MITVSLSKEEIANLIQLLDIATKAGGLQVAQAALLIASKLQMAQNAAVAETNVVPIDKSA